MEKLRSVSYLAVKCFRDSILLVLYSFLIFLNDSRSLLSMCHDYEFIWARWVSSKNFKECFKVQNSTSITRDYLSSPVPLGEHVKYLTKRTNSEQVRAYRWSSCSMISRECPCSNFRVHMERTQTRCLFTKESWRGHPGEKRSYENAVTNGSTS